MKDREEGRRRWTGRTARRESCGHGLGGKKEEEEEGNTNGVRREGGWKEIFFLFLSKKGEEGRNVMHLKGCCSCGT